jgi:hypothetical protein
MSLEDVDVCFENDDIVLAKTFALTYGVSSAEATAVITDYASTHTSSIQHHLITGLLKATPSILTIMVVSANRLSETINTFQVIYHQALYSIQKHTCVDYNSVAYFAQEEKCAEILLATPNNEHYLLNKLGCIHIDVSVQSCGQKQKPSLLIRPAAIVDKTKALLSAPAIAGSKADVAKVVNFFDKSATGDVKEPKENKNNSSTASKVIKTKAIASNPFSSSQSQIRLNTDSKACVTTTETLQPLLGQADTVSAPNTTNMDLEEYAVNSDEEWEDGYKPDKNNLAKMGKAFGAPEGTGGMHAPEISEDLEDADIPVVAVTNKRGKVHVRGALDDFVDDSIPSTLNATGRVKKRKLVPKLFEDEKGYLVTEMVWEEYSEDEAESKSKVAKTEPVKAMVVGDLAPDEKKKGKSAIVKKEVAKNVGAQKSMMSFFGKK